MWSVRTTRNIALRPSIAVVPPARPANHILIAASTKQTGRDTAFHFYSPLHDPPPVPTPEQLRYWGNQLNTTLFNEIKPDLSGPPLAGIYAKEAAKANHGDVQAAVTLFKGLTYREVDTGGSLDTEQELNAVIGRMQETQTDRDGAPTNNLAAAITDVQQQYHYCAGLAAIDNPVTIDHWARLASQSDDPATLAWSAPAASQPSVKEADTTTPEQIQKKSQSMVNRAAQAGVARAWLEKWAGYRNGDGGYPADPVRAYASLYTEYMLTKSPMLAYQIWKLSQQLNSLQVEEGETIAHNNYQRIQAREKIQ